MPKFKKNTSPAMYKKPSSFKMKKTPLKSLFKGMIKPGVSDGGTLNLGGPNTFKSEMGRAVRNFKSPERIGTLPRVTSKLAKAGNIAGNVARVGSRLLGGAGIVSLLADFHKSGQKKSGGKVRKGQKTNTMGFGNKSIFKK